MQDPYEVLGVSRSATDEEITSAYKKLARKYHPDLNPGDKNAEKKMQEINGAYETIKDIRSGKKTDSAYYGSSSQGYGPSSQGGYRNPYGNPYGNPFDPFGAYGQNNGTYGQANGTYGQDSGTNGGQYGPFVWRTWSPGSSGSSGRRRGSPILRFLAIFLILRLILSLFSSLFSGGRSRSYYSYNPYYGYYYTSPDSGYGYYGSGRSSPYYVVPENDSGSGTRSEGRGLS